MVLEDY